MAPRKQTAVSTTSVRESLAALQSAMREALAGVPRLSGTRPVDLVAALGLDLKLAWKLARIAQTSDPFASVRHLPGAAGWRIALDAIRRAGAVPATCDRLAAAFDEATRIGAAWGGDRRAFEMMAAGIAAGSDMRIDVEHRRQLYLGGSYVWGVRARLQLRLDVLGPSAKGRRLDCATVRGVVDLERLRLDAPWQFEAPLVLDDKVMKPSSCTAEPIEHDAQAERGARRTTPHGPFLMREFSSDPLPEMRVVGAPGQAPAIELAEGAVGSEGRITLFQGTILRNVQPAQTSRRHHGIFQMSKQRTPVERTVFDLVVHESLLRDSPTPEAILYSDLLHPSGVRLHASTDRIPAGLEVLALGSGARRLKLSHFDRYAELALSVFERTGWNPSQFHVFRVEAPYPPVPSTLVLEMPITD
jgi:hypothetical protein